MNRLVQKIKLKARSIMFTALVAIGLLQWFVGFILDGVLYGLALIVVWIYLKIVR